MGTKLIKFTVFVVDHEDYGSDSYHAILNQDEFLNAYAVYNDGEADLGKWDDDIDINKTIADRKTYERYFK